MSQDEPGVDWGRSVSKKQSNAIQTVRLPMLYAVVSCMGGSTAIPLSRLLFAHAHFTYYNVHISQASALGLEDSSASRCFVSEIIYLHLASEPSPVVIVC